MQCGSLFEIWMALQLRDDGCSFDIIMPPSQRRSFEKALLKDFKSIQMSLSRVALENAQATVEADKLAIHQLVREGMGFAAVDEEVLAALRGWLLAAGEAALAAVPEAEREAATGLM